MKKSNINAICSDLETWPKPQCLQRPAMHRIGWRDAGCRQGEPWLLVHGGPGGSCQPSMLAAFDLQRQRVIALDQRGSGASRPKGGIRGSHVMALVQDMEALRRHLGLERWSLLAGSWGTVLALLYAHHYPQHVQRLVLRGSFGASSKEIGALLRPASALGKALPALRRINWSVQSAQAVPQALAKLGQVFQSATPNARSLGIVRGWNLLELRDALRGIQRSLIHADGKLAMAMRRERAQLKRQQRRAASVLKAPGATVRDAQLWQKYRLQAHYLGQRRHLQRVKLDAAVKAIAQQRIAVDWVHGRFDAICPPDNSKCWFEMGMSAGGVMRLHQPHCGHLGSEAEMLLSLRYCVHLLLKNQ